MKINNNSNNNYTLLIESFITRYKHKKIFWFTLQNTYFFFSYKSHKHKYSSFIFKGTHIFFLKKEKKYKFLGLQSNLGKSNDTSQNNFFCRGSKLWNYKRPKK